METIIYKVIKTVVVVSSLAYLFVQNFENKYESNTLKKEVTNGVIKSNLKYYVGNYGVNEKNTNSVYFEILDGFENSELINNVCLSGVKTLIGDVANLNKIIKNYKLEKS